MSVVVRLIVAFFLLSLVSACVSSAMYSNSIEQEYPPLGDFVEVDGKAQHVILRGDGHPVMMVHGASANAREYMITLAPHLEDEGVSLIIPDRTGHGYSERVENGNELGVQAATLNAIQNQYTSDKIILVGHSFGGAVSLRYALDYPDRVSAVVLIAPVTNDWGEGGVTWYNKVAAVPAFGSLFSQVAPLVGPKAARSSLEGLFSPAPVPENYADKMGVDLLFRPPIFRYNALDMVILKDQLAEQEVRYPGLSVPVIVFSGSYDTVLKPKLHAARLKRANPEYVTLVKLDDEGHMPHHGKAELIATTILRLARGESVQETDFEIPNG